MHRATRSRDVRVNVVAFISRLVLRWPAQAAGRVLQGYVVKRCLTSPSPSLHFIAPKRDFHESSGMSMGAEVEDHGDEWLLREK